MTAVEGADAVDSLRQQLTQGNPEVVLATMVTAFANALISTEADAVCGVAYGQRGDEWTNRRNGYRPRGWDTHAGTSDLQISVDVCACRQTRAPLEEGVDEVKQAHDFVGRRLAAIAQPQPNPRPSP